MKHNSSYQSPFRKLGLASALCFILSFAIAQPSKRAREVTRAADSLRVPVLSLPRPDSLAPAQVKKLDSAYQRLNKKIDSLQRIQLPTNRIQQKLDSLEQKLVGAIARQPALDTLRQKFQRLRASTAQKLDTLNARIALARKKLESATTLQMPDSLKTSLKALGVHTPALPQKNPGAVVQIPQVPGALSPKDWPTSNAQLPGISGNPLAGVQQRVNELQKQPQAWVQQHGAGSELKKAQAMVQQVNQAGEKVNAYKEDLTHLAEGNAERVEQLPQELEKAAMRTELMQPVQKELQQFTSQRNMLEQYKEMAASLQRPDSLANQAKEKAMAEAQEKTEALFATEHEKVKKGLAQFDKLKMRYGNIADSRYLPKRVPHAMKGRPFRERLVPGVSFQIFKPGDVAIDIEPYVAYKLTGRFRPGVGFFFRERLHKGPSLRYDEVFGFRAFNGLRINRQFFFHTEAEWIRFTEASLNTYTLPIDKPTATPNQFRLHVGFQRNYRISKRFNGTVQLLYNVWGMTKFPEARHTSTRLGVEYVFRKKEERAKSEQR